MRKMKAKKVNKMAHYSLLRYPGGKGKMYLQTLKILEDNDLLGCTYIEPFAGGGNLALNLLFRGKVDSIILNDNDPAIYSVWASILFYGNEFIELIKNTPITLEERDRQKQIYLNKPNDVLALGFSTFYLNRTNRSGIITAGPIGGYSQKGNYLIDCRFNKEKLIQRVETILKYKEKMQIFDFDAKDFLELNFHKNSFFFIDPPYYVKGSQLYRNYFKKSDHEELAKKVENLDYPWIVTYDNVDDIISIYEFCNHFEYNLTYTIEKKYKGSEVLFYKHGLSIEMLNSKSNITG